MILEVSVVIVIILLFILLGFEKHENKNQTSKLINALMAKTNQEFRDLELTDKVEAIKPPQKSEPDLIHESELEDEQFKKFIDREVG